MVDPVAGGVWTTARQRQFTRRARGWIWLSAVMASTGCSFADRFCTELEACEGSEGGDPGQCEGFWGAMEDQAEEKGCEDEWDKKCECIDATMRCENHSLQTDCDSQDEALTACMQ